MGVFDRTAARRAHLDVGNPLRALTDVIQKVEGGINLGQGVCDLEAPKSLRVGAMESIEGVAGDRQTYTPYLGLPETREQIARRLRSYNGLEVGPNNVAVTLGSSGAFFACGMTLFEPGDEVILFEPFYSYHRSTLRLMGVTPVFVRLSGPELSFDIEALQRALSPKTRAVILNTPANPSGKVFDRAELEQVGQALAGTDVVVMTDEVYEYMVFDGCEHISPATVPSLADRTLTLGGYSKTFSVTGWRIGYVAGPEDVIDKIGLVCDQLHVCAPRPMQRGVERALAELPDAFFDDLRAVYEQKRDSFCQALEDAGFGVVRPQGAYYVLADYRNVLGADLEPYDAAHELIRRIGVNGVPGHVFYEDPADVRSIRFHFAVTPDVLEDACSRLRSLRQ